MKIETKADNILLFIFVINLEHVRLNIDQIKQSFDSFKKIRTD